MAAAPLSRHDAPARQPVSPPHPPAASACAEPPLLYGELAGWFHVLSPPADYREEATLYAELLGGRSAPPHPTLLELGAGAGCNAVHLKRHFACTLTDRAPQMLAASRSLNPECEHLAGDMRSLRLGRHFDAVLIHDALCYLLDEDELRAALATAHAHCRTGGRALFVPDHVAEGFQPATAHGGSDATDGSGRGLRYLEWCWQPEPGSRRYRVDYALLLREGGRVSLRHDTHECGLFPRADWQRLIREAGFRPEPLPALPADIETGELFLATRP